MIKIFDKTGRQVALAEYRSAYRHWEVYRLRLSDGESVNIGLHLNFSEVKKLINWLKTVSNPRWDYEWKSWIKNFEKSKENFT